MKNRQKFTVSEKSLLNKIELFDREVDKKFLELRAKKKIASNPLIQKNIHFLQAYNNLFKKFSCHSGDADTVFRKSLRNFNSLDIIRDLHLENSPLLKTKKDKKQRSALTKHHCENFPPFFKKSEDLAQKKCVGEVSTVEGTSSLKELFSKPIAEEQFESSSESDDRDDYFSPLAAPFQAGSKTYQEEGQRSNRKEEFQEEEEEPFISQSEVNQEGEKEDEKVLTEVKQQESSSVLSISKKNTNLNNLKIEDTTDDHFKMAEDFEDDDMEAEFQRSETEYETDYEEDDELKDVEQMIQQASEELQKVAEENQQVMETLDEGDEDEALLQITEPTTGPKVDKGGNKEATTDGSYFKFDPAIDAALLRELEEAEKQAKATAKVITELKNRVGELLLKETMTEAEAKELEEKNKTLKAQMILFEEKTKRIQFLLGQANLFDQMIPVQPPLQTKHAEDILPKMLVCGVTDDFMPKIVLCHDRKKAHRHRPRSGSQGRGPSALSPITRKLDESYNMQERLVTENVDLQGTRYKLQSDIYNKDRAVECLQKQLCSIQNEMRMVYQENAMLKGQSQDCPNPSCPKNSRSNSPTRRGQTSCGGGRGLCPADVENRLQEYSNTTSQLEKQLVDIEREVSLIQQQLTGVQKERKHLEYHRKVLAYCQRSPCQRPPCQRPPCQRPPCPARSVRRSKERTRDDDDDSDECSFCAQPNAAALGDAPVVNPNIPPQTPSPSGSPKPQTPDDCPHPPIPPYPPISDDSEDNGIPTPSECGAAYPPCSPFPPCPYGPPCQPFPPCPPWYCKPPPCWGPPPCQPCPPPCQPCPPCGGEENNTELKECREKYKQLLENFKAKVTEIAGLRADNEKLKEIAEKAEAARQKLEAKVKELEKKIKDMRGEGGGGDNSKEQLIELQQQIKVYKELYRQAQDELEELRACVEDLQTQMNEYREKYLEAVQMVEEQRRQIDLMKLENNRVSEQVNLEIQRIKNQFQEKLQELAPLPDILKATQAKLQEAQQMHLIAERNNECLARELETCREKIKILQQELEIGAGGEHEGQNVKEQLEARIKEIERELQERKEENDEIRIEMEKYQEKAEEQEKIANSKIHEITQLEAQLETVREESARQVSRIKERCELVRKSMQNQINCLETQLAQMRACVRAAEKDRDEVRVMMQAQIRNLNENFEDAQMRIKNLQGHVNFLKNQSTCITPTELCKPNPCPKPDPSKPTNSFPPNPCPPSPCACPPSMPFVCPPDPCCCPGDYGHYQ